MQLPYVGVPILLNIGTPTRRASAAQLLSCPNPDLWVRSSGWRARTLIRPTDLDVYKPERWLDNALLRPEVRDAYRRLVDQGWTDALRALHPGERIYTFWDYFRNAYGRDAGLRIDIFC